MSNIENKKKILKYLIVVVTIICLVCLIILILINKRTEEKSNNVYQEKNDIQDENQVEYEDVITEQESKDTSRMLKYTDNRINYFTVRALVQNYIDASAYRSANQVISVLSNNYINEYKITEENIFNYIDIKQVSNQKIYLSYNTEEIIESEQENYIVAYIVSSKYRMSNSTKYTATKTLVILDKNEGKYEIYPYKYLLDNNLYNLKAGDKLDLKISSLSENASKFLYQEKTDKELANELFNDWNEKIIYDRLEAYNKLNSEYKNQKFNNYNKFDNYLSNLGYIPQINQYRVYSGSDYTDYICTDQYNNYYIFRQQGGIMRYTVFLDNYTVELDSFKENYEKADDSTKVAIQIGKFKQMLNSKDYNAIYEKLNSTFRNNNFPKVSDLESYIKKNVYTQNSIEIGKEEEKDGYYACECTLINLKNSDEKKNINIMIKLIDSNNFEISFSIN